MGTTPPQSQPEPMISCQPETETAALPEKLVQKVWLRQAFRRRLLRTLSGKTLRIRQPGTWNHTEGPDFLDAAIELDGAPLRGAIELHHRRRDWQAHGHDADPRYDPVVLHVVVSAPRPREARARTRSGHEPETLVLLDWLDEDLAGLAAEEALITANGQDRLHLLEPLLPLGLEERRRRLRGRALRRWRQKRAFARRRLEAHGWEETCHQLTLEALGYHRNRAAMGRIALAWPLERWRAHEPQPEALFHEQAGRWCLAGVRPANHPLQRLRQYAALVRADPHWPRALQEQGAALARERGRSESTGAFRRRAALTALREAVGASVLAGALSGPRLDTLMVDVFLPLLAEARGEDAFGWWFHWYGGDLPAPLHQARRLLGLCDGREWPVCNGWQQGLIALAGEGPAAA